MHKKTSGAKKKYMLATSNTWSGQQLFIIKVCHRNRNRRVNIGTALRLVLLKQQQTNKSIYEAIFIDSHQLERHYLLKFLMFVAVNHEYLMYLNPYIWHLSVWINYFNSFQDFLKLR